jgi:mono/diheme cytochrome c family protein
MTTKYLLTTLALVAACKSEPAAQKPSPVERGKLLVATSGCHDCHTPLKMGDKGPEPDFSRQLSGHPAGLVMPPAPTLPAGPWLVTVAATNTAWAGPWGVSFTRNLTPDKETGIGSWTKQMFIDTIRNGRHMGVGRPLLPPMPAAGYAQMSDDDLGAIYAYLESIPAIKNQVPEPIAPQQAQLAPPTEQIASH